MGKRQNRPERNAEVVELLHSHGISTRGSLVKLTLALFAILTPYPGTRPTESSLPGPVNGPPAVAQTRSCSGVAVLRPSTHDSRSAARGVGESLAAFLFESFDPRSLERATPIELVPRFY